MFTLKELCGRSIVFCGVFLLACASGLRQAPTAQGDSVSVQAPDDLAGIDTVVRFRTEIQPDSTLALGEIEGSVVSARNGAPLVSAPVSLVYADHHHTQRPVLTDATGRFRIRGLPPEKAVIYCEYPGYYADSVTLDPSLRKNVRFALRVSPGRIQY
jgi:hypothetical protein